MGLIPKPTLFPSFSSPLFLLLTLLQMSLFPQLLALPTSTQPPLPFPLASPHCGLYLWVMHVCSWAHPSTFFLFHQLCCCCARSSMVPTSVTRPLEHAWVLLGMCLYTQSITQPHTQSSRGHLEAWAQSLSWTRQLHVPGCQLDQPPTLMAPPAPAGPLSPGPG